jgi:hypothetical protein
MLDTPTTRSEELETKAVLRPDPAFLRASGWRMIIGGAVALGILWAMPVANFFRDQPLLPNTDEKDIWPMLGVMAATSVCVVGLLLLVRRRFVRAWCVAVGDRLLVYSYPRGLMGDVIGLVCGPENPLVLQTDARRRHWLISTRNAPRRRMRIPCRAFPGLAAFLKEHCPHAVIEMPDRP